MALSAIITDVSTIRPQTPITIDCEASNDALLLVGWLNALMYRMAVDRMLFCRFAVRIDNHRLPEQARGEGIDRARHTPPVEPKGATYTALKVERSGESRAA